MNKEVKQYLSIWEEKQIRESEKKASLSEHIFSKEFEEKINTISEQKKPNKKITFRINTAAVSAAVILFIIFCYFSDIQGLAGGWLEEFLHLQIAIIQEDQSDTQEKILVKMEEKKEASDEISVQFYTLINMTEREYWNYLKEHELPAQKGPKYLPDGYVLDENMHGTSYSYVYEEKTEEEFDDTKTLQEVFPGTGFIGTDKKQPLKPGEDMIKIKGRDVKLVLREIRKTWKKGKKELYYYERIHDWTKRNVFNHIKSYEKVLIGERDAYVLKANNKVSIIFYQESSKIIFSGTGEDQEQIYQELVKMAESLS